MAASQLFLSGGRWCFSLFTCCAWEDEREPEKNRHARERVEDMSVCVG